MTKQITLPHGLYALVDDADFERLARHRWYAHKDCYTYYAVRRVGTRAECKTIAMHREIMNAPDGIIVDHINGNGLDNRRANLRLCTDAENRLNSRVRSDNRLGLKGVSQDNRRYRGWRARIKLHGKAIRLGVFPTPGDAARAYDKAARWLFGQFARTNFDDV